MSENMLEQARLAADQALQEAMRAAPYWASAIHTLGLTPVDPADCPTAMTDGVRMFYNPAYLLGLAPQVRVTLVLHEAWHVLRAHFDRRQGREAARWNKACDHELNDALAGAGYTLGDGWLRSHTFTRMCAEEIYDLLPPEKGDGKPGDGDGAGAGAGADMGQTPASAPAMPEARQNAARARIAQAANNKPEGGHGWLASAITAYDKRLVEYQEAVAWGGRLADWLKDKFQTEKTWARPSRRHMARGEYRPGDKPAGLATVIFGLDVSGSMKADIVARACNVASAVMAECHIARLVLVPFNTRIGDVKEYSYGETVDATYKPGGGTCFRPLFGFAREQGDIAGLVIVSDMDTSAREYEAYAGTYPCLAVHYGAQQAHVLAAEKAGIETVRAA